MLCADAYFEAADDQVAAASFRQFICAIVDPSEPLEREVQRSHVVGDDARKLNLEVYRRVAGSVAFDDSNAIDRGHMDLTIYLTIWRREQTAIGYEIEGLTSAQRRVGIDSGKVNQIKDCGAIV
jgi:hypothetical protein